ncbi:MAG TPA: immunoglobulin domain-containing protein, partial [Candidatus Acidoferrales bacterium]
DARNGAAYTAATAIAYSAGTTYHFILDVNLAAHTYNASVVVNGAPVVIGTNFKFRSEQSGVSSLSNVASMASSGTQTICNVAVSMEPVAPVAPSITTQPLSQTVTSGQTATFSVAGAGTAPLSYQWQKNGSAISGATASTYQTPVTTSSDNGSQFTVAMSNAAGNATSSGATLTVKAPAVAPSITMQPVSQTVTSGQTATFSVAGTGTAPMTYQWQKNGSAISGAISSTYQTPVTAVSDTGSQFSVVMSNTAGSVISGSAALTVNPPAVAPSITTQPLSQSVTAGQTATFSVAGTGTSPMSYQWQKNGSAISGATSSTYQTPVTTNSDNGSQFAAVMSNSAGNVTSSLATLTVLAAGCVTSSASWVNSALPQLQTGTFRLEFDVTPASTGIDGVIGLSSGPASDYPNLATIIRFNDTGTIDARNGAAYTAATAIPYSAGTAYHFVLDVYLAAHTYDASVVVNGATVVIGSQLAFRSEQAGVSSLSNIGAIATLGSQLMCNVTISSVPPSITTQPVSQTVTPGQTATFSVAASGTAPMSYQWQKNGTAISGATSSSYQTPAATLSDNGSQFTVAISNAASRVTSSSGTLAVISGTVLLGASSTQLSFGSVDVSSNGVQNVTITNAGNSNVTISNVSVSGAGFNAGGGVAGLILSPGQTAPLSVTFAPAAVGSASGSVTVTSNATNSPITIALAGTGAAQSHSVNLNWTASTSSVTGYNIYSSRVSGGPYVKLNPSPMPATSYIDKTVQAGLVYYYVTTAVGSGSSAPESGFSAEVSAVVP